MTAIPVDITTQEDYMYGEGGVSVEKPSAALVMKHALSLVRILIKRMIIQVTGWWMRSLLEV